MVHHVGEDTGEFQAVLLVDDEFLLDAEIEVEIGRPLILPAPPELESRPRIRGRTLSKTATGLVNRLTAAEGLPA